MWMAEQKFWGKEIASCEVISSQAHVFIENPPRGSSCSISHCLLRQLEITMLPDADVWKESSVGQPFPPWYKMFTLLCPWVSVQKLESVLTRRRHTSVSDGQLFLQLCPPTPTHTHLSELRMYGQPWAESALHFVVEGWAPSSESLPSASHTLAENSEVKIWLWLFWLGC